LGVSQAWFYKWRHGDGSLRRKRRAVLAALIAYLFTQHHGSYGSPRITADLRDLGWQVSKNTVAKLMAHGGLVARRRRKRRLLTRADRSARKPADALGRDFTPPERPDVRWCGDLTEIPTDEGTFYLAAILDLHSRRCVGFALGAHHDAELARAALCVAIAVRGGSVTGVVFHSDQGGEYTGELFVDACRRAEVTQSMGRTGSALDNAVAESFNSTLEFELLRDHHFATREQARRAVASWIDEYNTIRRHSTNHMLNPVDYERPDAGWLAGGMTSASPRRRRSNDTEAASPPLIFPGRAAQATGPPLRPQGSLPRSLRDGLQPPLTPETSAAPGRQQRGQGQGLPRQARGATSTITKDPRSHYPESLRLQGIAALTFGCPPVAS